MSKQDLWIIFAVIALGLLAWLAFALFGMGTTGEAVQAVITVDGKVVETVKLDQSQTITIQGAAYPCIVETKPGQIRMLEAPCPDQICVKTGWISHGGQVIACVPNRVVIKIVAEESPVDAISY